MRRFCHHVRMPHAPDTALLAVNLGTPEAPTAAAVRRYLGEFLSDPRVVAIPRFIWLPLLHGVILPLRGPRAAEKYAQIWLPEGSPLAVHTRRLAEAMQPLLPEWRVAHAMRYGQPAMPAMLQQLRSEGIRRVVVLPLYPQYSTTTTASISDLLAREAGAAAKGMVIEVIEDYPTDEGWVAAVAASIRAHWQRHGRGQRLLFSYHGLPQRVADAGDPYPQRCEASTRAIVDALGLGDGEWTMTYQSRFGKERWLEPATDAMLDRLAGEGVRKIDVVCPGFAVDCLETLEEIGIGLAERFAHRGGELRYIPCLNDSPAHARALADLACRHIGLPGVAAS